ncbi:MAG: DUF4124 domain-containing protein [Comamonadaceae bacterium]|nr:MAG: DUF4124 domain-containing protein [Comamonadaceae bacterium]
MNAFRIALVALVCSAPLAALSQWQWLDKDNRKVFSDQAPPPDVPANRILRQPGQRGPAAAPVAEPVSAPAAAAKPALPKPSGVDKTLEERKKQAEAAEAAKKKAEDDKFAALQAENCQRAKQAKATYDSGVRVARVNDKGEREFIDDAARAAESKRLAEVIARDCVKAQ